jgi:hypothetical protein
VGRARGPVFIVHYSPGPAGRRGGSTSRSWPSPTADPLACHSDMRGCGYACPHTYEGNSSMSCNSPLYNATQRPSTASEIDTCITLRRDGGHFVLQPRPDTIDTHDLLASLPPMNGDDFERMTQVLRVAWKRHRLLLTWKLYLDPSSRTWHSLLVPPEGGGMYELTDPPAAAAETLDLFWPQLRSRRVEWERFVLAGNLVNLMLSSVFVFDRSSIRDQEVAGSNPVTPT